MLAKVHLRRVECVHLAHPHGRLQRQIEQRSQGISLGELEGTLPSLRLLTRQDPAHALLFFWRQAPIAFLVFLAVAPPPALDTTAPSS